MGMLVFLVVIIWAVVLSKLLTIFLISSRREQNSKNEQVDDTIKNKNKLIKWFLEIDKGVFFCYIAIIICVIFTGIIAIFA